MPVHVPLAAVRVEPTCGLPEIDGGAVLAGGEAVTTAVTAEVAAALPAEFEAVTVTASVEPRSADAIVYVAAVAPAMAAHDAPPESHRCHW